MTQNLMSPAAAVPAARHNLNKIRGFYVGAACLMLLLMIIGFRHFYLEWRAHPGREIPPPIRTLVIVHGISMTAWVLIFVVQSLLIAAKRPRIHMAIGRVAAAFAVAIVISGLLLAVQSTRIAPPEFVLWGLTGRQFMAVPFFSILIFGGMVAAGVIYRRRPAIHRPMMLFATLSALGAATARIDAINGLYQATVWENVFGPFLAAIVVGAILVLVRWMLTKSFDKWFAISYGIVLIAFLLAMQIARTSAWEQFVNFVVG